MILLNDGYTPFCCERIENIENYKQAMEDSERCWVIHHRKETDNGYLTPKELIKKNLYYNRPASELIFLSVSDHVKLHSKCKGKKSGQNV